MASTGNATDFGDATVTKTHSGGSTNLTRGVMGGGNNPDHINVIDYITIASTGNATDFGDLLANRAYLGGASGD